MLYIKLHLSPDEIDYLRSATKGEPLHLEQDLPEPERQAAFRTADIVLGNPPVDWLATNKKLQWVQLSSAGFQAYTVLHDRDLSFSLTNCAGIFGTPVAETAVAGIMALLRGIPTFVDDKRGKHWRGAAIRPHLGKLTGSTVIILGHGDIGGTICQLLGGFGCEVATMGHREGTGADFYTREELDARLPAADIVIAALPETKETVQFFDADRLSLLSKECILVNVGRGSLIDETSLLKLLRAGRIGGAVLDVTGSEPLPPDDPLWDAPRTILTQHSAGGASDENRRIIDRFVGNLKRYRKGEPLEYLVDLKRGY
ncbi:phosphoglycerate dehydrogenase-like enzyme [Lewinella aquimaris]|uniref:Phosphoglycerate dehydrogenase-like enzyme n=1 Tax=Neolewinella aquimaris TaxID=1835722 RepID=A0A840EC04_9BACT|nr:D-2-hydroxyacid dehydrogenase [Neolewinella aquimaris]MBB4080987.1 phosphoglycerate dehydrogenase-like enzyme [Neolewinella aquimaris]